MHLTVQNERIDRLAAVVDRGVAADFDRAGVRIDLGLAHRGAGRIGRDAPGEGRLRPQRPAQIVRQRGQIVDGTGNIEQGQTPVAVGRHEQSVGERNVAFGHVEHGGGNPARLVDHGARGLDHQRTGKTHGAIGMGPAAGGERRAVAAHEIDRVRLNAELIGHHLPEAGLVALPARLRSDDEIDAACGRAR